MVVCIFTLTRFISATLAYTLLPFLFRLTSPLLSTRSGILCTESTDPVTDSLVLESCSLMALSRASAISREMSKKPLILHLICYLVFTYSCQICHHRSGSSSAYAQGCGRIPFGWRRRPSRGHFSRQGWIWPRLASTGLFLMKLIRGRHGGHAADGHHLELDEVAGLSDVRHHSLVASLAYIVAVDLKKVNIHFNPCHAHFHGSLKKPYLLCALSKINTVAWAWSED